MTVLAPLALAELHQRKASVDSAVAAGFYPRDKAERLLRCWLSIALAAGADPGDCSALLGIWAEEHGFDSRLARIVLLDDGPPREEWLAELARARDAAGNKARAHPTDLKLSARHHALDSLCIYLGGPSEMQSAQRDQSSRSAAVGQPGTQQASCSAAVGQLETEAA